MAEKKQYDSIIDAILDEREPDWKDLEMEEEQKSGKEQMNRTHQYVDTDFEDEIAESASRHTPIWGPKSGTHTYEERIAEKEAASPRIHSVTAYRRMEDYKSKDGDNDSLMDEVTENIEKAYTNNNLAENSAAKKEVSDAQVFKYVRDLLNQGASPAKVAQQLQKLAEIELFNHQSATDYLQRNAGLLGLAYLEPNTYMDKNSPTYERKASGSADCVQQKRAWDSKGIKPQAKSVKQVSACSGCTYMEKNGSTKTCSLYGLPLVANVEELTQIVNHLTAGVPQKHKHAALVQIANGAGKGLAKAAASYAYDDTMIVKTADAKVSNQNKRANYEFKDEREASLKFSSEHVEKLHQKGASLEQIYKWGEEKFGSVDVSFAFRGFVQGLKKNASGKIEIASKDLSFLNRIGIRNAAFEGKEKCASCNYHHKRALTPAQSWQEPMPSMGMPFEEESVDIQPCVNCGADQRNFTYDEHGEVFCTSCGEVQPISQQDLLAYQQSGKTSSKAGRVGGKFASSTIDKVRSTAAETKEVVVTAGKVRKLHQAGHSVEKIYKSAANKVGSVEARKAVAGYIADYLKTPGKIAFGDADRAFLVRLGFKEADVNKLQVRRIHQSAKATVTARVPDDQNLLSYPGMEKRAGEEKKVVDGMSILTEYDLIGGHDMQDIDTGGPKRDDVEMKQHTEFDLE